MIKLYLTNWYMLYLKMAGSGAIRKVLISAFFGAVFLRDGDLCHRSVGIYEELYWPNRPYESCIQASFLQYNGFRCTFRGVFFFEPGYQWCFFPVAVQDTRTKI
jgi:hypothetical protein